MKILTYKKIRKDMSLEPVENLNFPFYILELILGLILEFWIGKLIFVWYDNGLSDDDVKNICHEMNLSPKSSDYARDGLKLVHVFKCWCYDNEWM